MPAACVGVERTGLRVASDSKRSFQRRTHGVHGLPCTPAKSVIRFSRIDVAIEFAGRDIRAGQISVSGCTWGVAQMRSLPCAAAPMMDSDCGRGWVST
jgi:hypothetical protein